MQGMILIKEQRYGFFIYLCPVMDEESGFIQEPGQMGAEVGPALLHRSEKGFSELWRANKHGRFIVLKCLRKEFRGDPFYESLLKKEFETGYELNHPSICRTLDFQHHPLLGSCIELEWIDGVTINERFVAGAGEKLFRKVAGELCDAVSYLHSHQIVHRDIKPSNILVTHMGDNVKLIDFGFSDSTCSSIFKMQAGTESYIAPEVVSGGKADIRSDVWAVGKVLSPLTASHRSVLEKACSDNPENRYQHISDLKEALLRPVVRPWMYIAAALLVAAVSIFSSLWEVRSKGDLPPSNLPEEIVRAVPPAAAETPEESVETPAPAARSTVKSKVTEEEIDDLFREATGMFE